MARHAVSSGKGEKVRIMGGQVRPKGYDRVLTQSGEGINKLTSNGATPGDLGMFTARRSRVAINPEKPDGV